MFLTRRILKEHQRLIFPKSLHLENVFPPAAPFIIKVEIYSVIWWSLTQSCNLDASADWHSFQAQRSASKTFAVFVHFIENCWKVW